MHLMIHFVPVLTEVKALYGINRRLLCRLDGTHKHRTWGGMESFEC